MSASLVFFLPFSHSAVKFFINSVQIARTHTASALVSSVEAAHVSHVRHRSPPFCHILQVVARISCISVQ